MKIAGYILTGIGGLSTVLGIIGIAGGYQDANLSGLAPLVLGIFLLSRANQNEEEERKRNKWKEGKPEN